VLLFGVAAAAGQEPPKVQAAGGVEMGAPRFRALRSISGTKGLQQGGRFVMEDPRTVFYIPEDKQVIVYFEWEGPLGPHVFEGLWKNPEGKVAAISEFKYEAKDKQFGGYWSLVLTATMPTGLWSLEARIDGEVAGTHAFQVLATSRPADAVPTRRILTPAEIYEQTVPATVAVESFASNGERINSGSGFFMVGGLLATAFQVIDGASALRILLRDGRRLEANLVVAWNRRQDWAILKTNSGHPAQLQRASPPPTTIGDRCYTLGATADGGRALVEATVTGKYTPQGAGERLTVSASLEPATAGAPLLNEYGEVLGIIGGELVPGANSLRLTRSGFSPVLPSTANLAVPISLVRAVGPEAPAATLDELARRGEFILPVTASRHVLYGNLSRGLDRSKKYPEPLDVRYEFSRRDKKMFLLVMWEPKDKVKSTTTLRIYDNDNHAVAATQRRKANLRPGERFYTTTELPTADFAPGVYRLDVLLGDEPAWRTFFRILE